MVLPISVSGPLTYKVSGHYMMLENVAAEYFGGLDLMTDSSCATEVRANTRKIQVTKKTLRNI